MFTRDDYPGVLQDHPQILIEFHALSCGHCKKLVPIYAEAAQKLAAKGFKGTLQVD
jgi:thiol-disulfide isomerase/thioredoxin